MSACTRPCTTESSRIAPARRRRARAQARGAARAAASIAQALAEVRELLGDAPRRRDLLIEHLHRIQDRFGHLSAAHLAALAQEMRLAQTEVYEVATFYHHFDIVKEGEARAAAAHRARLRRPVVRDGRRAATCWRGCRPCSAADVRVIARAVHRPLRAGAGGGGRPEPGAARDAARRVAAAVAGRRDRSTSPTATSTYAALPRRRAATRCCASASPASATSSR